MRRAERLRAPDDRHVFCSAGVAHGSADGASPNSDNRRTHSGTAHSRARHIGANIDASSHALFHAVANTFSSPNDAGRRDPNSARRGCNGHAHRHPGRIPRRHGGRACRLAPANRERCASFGIRFWRSAGDHRCPQTDLPQ